MKGKTTIFKWVAALSLALLICVCASPIAYAESYSAGVEENDDFSLESSENEPVLSENVAEDTQNGKENAPSVENSLQNTVGESENLFEQIYLKVCEYASEILSVMTLVGTLIVGFAYKKGLLPLVSRAISAIQSSVNKIKSDTEEGAKSTSLGMDSLSERLSGVENSLSLVSEDLMELSAKLECESECIKERKRMKTILTSQIDMLYDIFMTSSLPQYQKDATGARIQCMREELAAYETGEKQ